MATGGIAGTYVRDLLLDPATRQVHDVKHDVVAVASSTSKERAEQFVKENKCKESTRAYGSYDELVKDADVDIVYVASPHSHHYENALLALEHGKAVCCEKPFTVNARQAKHLVHVAKAKVSGKEEKKGLVTDTLIRFVVCPLECLLDGSRLDPLLSPCAGIAENDPQGSHPRRSEACPIRLWQTL